MKRHDTRHRSSNLRSRPQPTHLAEDQSPGCESDRSKQLSWRPRSPETLDNAKPPSPLKDASTKSVPAVQPAAAKMSLFNIFSRPKVERARGHTERGLDAPIPAKKTRSGLKASASTPNLALKAQSDAPEPPRPTAPPPPVPSAKNAQKLKFKEPVKPSIRERKPGSFDPPPLFQAYPQSMKDGMLELSMLSAETVQQKSKSRNAGGGLGDGKAEISADDTASMDTKRSTMMHLKHVANGSVTHVELPKKIFVLVTAGYLFQYSETGPSDRLPERMLHLGKDSAAFACDLVPGKHYVLQVSQAVDRDGIVVINSGSLLSKLGIRTAAAKRMTSNFLLVMPDAREMESWMTAIRREIEAMGGTKMQLYDTPRVRATLSDSVDLRKTPSQSHRYKVQRDPIMVTPVATPMEIPTPVLNIPAKPEPDVSDTATIDGIEIEASKLTEEEPQPRARTRSPSDAPSVSSSVAASVDQQHLDDLRSSGSNKRFSKASQAPTVATTVSNSRANSLTGSPPSEKQPGSGLDAVQENMPQPSYRMLASYTSRRRSAAPANVLKDAQSLPRIDTSPPKAKALAAEQVAESPIVGHMHAQQITAPSPQPPKRLSVARSEPNLHSTVASHEKHDSKLPLPPLPQQSEKDRPESFIGELPSTSTWSSNRAASRRTSLLYSASAMTAQAQGSPTRNTKLSGNSPSQLVKPAQETTRSKRMSTLTIPLKINPSTPHAQPVSSSNRRRSSAHDPDPPGDTPVVHALTATVEPNRRASVAHTTMTANGIQKSPSQRLSLFPTPLVSPSAAPTPTSSPSPTQLSTPQSQTQATAKTLRRPTSMQVSSDRAPFLSSVRNSTNGPPAVRNFTAPTAPIRGLKPSRSASNVAALGHSHGSSTDAFKGLDFGLPPPNEDDDKPMPLPIAGTAPTSQSPLPPIRSSSRFSVQRAVKSRSSLPELDLGIPVVGLGPPAPPPSAPLPPPPTQSRPGSRLGSSRPSSPAPANGSPSAGIDAIAGLGIRVS